MTQLPQVLDAPPVEGTGVVRHIVEFDPATKQPKDNVLCGVPWDRVFLNPNGPICKECEELWKKLLQAGKVWGRSEW